MSNEYRVYGPPGVGKTTYLSQQVRRIADEFGRDAVMVASFTKTAAAEIASRDLGLGEKQVGTLHSFAYGAMGGGTVVEDRKGLTAWNEAYGREDRRVTLTGAKDDDLEFGGDSGSNKTEGDRLFSLYKLLRNRMTPRELWAGDVLLFAADWEDYKGEVRGIDFCDMIELALWNECAPRGNFAVAMIDEVQDLSALELSYARMVGKGMDHFVLAGDPNQAIYHFKGATPDAFLSEPIPPGNIRVLSRSHRVPRAVHGLAGNWQLMPLTYSPRDAEGSVDEDPMLTPLSFEYSPVLGELEERLRRGESTMLLASAAYLLKPVTAALRKRGLPFGNPYRPEQPDWNPLKSTKPWDPASKVMAFLRDSPEVWPSQARPPTFAELWGAVEYLDNGAFRYGAKAILKSSAADRFRKDDPVRDVAEYLADGAVSGSALQRLAWYVRAMWSKKQEPLEYVWEVALRFGWPSLQQTPLIVTGTIHSVKGGQADHVYIFPELSRSALSAWSVFGEERDAIIRTYYVGLTRAKEGVTLCGLDKDGVHWGHVHSPLVAS